MLVFAVALLVRFLFLAQFPYLYGLGLDQDPAGLPGDTQSGYDAIAQSILRGDGYRDISGVARNRRLPGYPLFLAVVYSVFGRNFVAVKIVQCLLDALTACMTAMIAWKASERRTIALLGGLLWSVYPFGVIMSATMTSETLFAFFLVLAIWMSLEWVDSPGPWRGAGVGLTLALAALTRPNGVVLLALPLVLLLVRLWVLRWPHQRAGVGLGSAVVMVGCMGMLVGAWLSWNQFSLGRFSYIDSEYSGWAFFCGASPMLVRTPVSERVAVAKDLVQPLEEELGPFERWSGTEHRRAGIYLYKQLLLASPLKFGAFLLEKFANQWYGTTSRRYMVEIAIVQFPLLLLAAIGLVYLCRQPESWQAWLLALIVGGFSLLCVLSWPTLRLMIPLMPVVLIFTAAGALVVLRFCGRVVAEGKSRGSWRDGESLGS